MPLLHSLIIVLFVFAAISGCSSSNNADLVDTEQTDNDPPIVIEVTPDLTGDDTRIETDQIIEIQFSELIDETSLSDGIKLSTSEAISAANTDDLDNTNSVSSNPINIQSINAPVVYTDPVTDIQREILATRTSVTLPPYLALDTHYKLEITTQIKDLSTEESTNPLTGAATTGNFLQGQDTYSFSTSKGRWFEPAFVTFDLTSKNIYTYSVQPDIDSALIVIGAQDAETANQFLYSTRFSLTDYSWTSIAEASASTDSIPMASDAFGRVTFPTLITETESGIAALWIQANTLTNSKSLYVSLHDGTNWSSTPTQLTQTVVVDIEEVSVTQDNQGRTVAVWIENEGAIDRLMRASIDLTVSPPILSNTQTLASSNSSTFSAAEIIANGTQIFARWLETDSGISTSRLARIYKDNSDEFSLLLESTAGSDSPHLNFAINDTGQGLVIWQEQTAGRYDLWRSWYDGDKFSTPELAERDNSGNAVSPLASTCYGGVAAAAWLQQRGTSASYDLLASIYNPNIDGWEEPETLTTSPSPVINLQGNFDNTCNFITSWSNQSNTSWAGNYYSMIDKSWANSRVLELTDNNATDQRLVSLGRSGRHLSIRARVDDNNLYSIEYALFDSEEREE